MRLLLDFDIRVLKNSAICMLGYQICALGKSNISCPLRFEVDRRLDFDICVLYESVMKVFEFVIVCCTSPHMRALAM